MAFEVFSVNKDRGNGGDVEAFENSNKNIQFELEIKTIMKPYYMI